MNADLRDEEAGISTALIPAIHTATHLSVTICSLTTPQSALLDPYIRVGQTSPEQAIGELIEPLQRQRISIPILLSRIPSTIPYQLSLLVLFEDLRVLARAGQDFLVAGRIVLLARIVGVEALPCALRARYGSSARRDAGALCLKVRQERCVVLVMKVSVLPRRARKRGATHIVAYTPELLDAAPQLLRPGIYRHYLSSPLSMTQHYWPWLDHLRIRPWRHERPDKRAQVVQHDKRACLSGAAGAS